VSRELQRFERRFPERLGLIHADLHFGNFLDTGAGPAAIDFDDCGRGFLAYDLAVPLTRIPDVISWPTCDMSGKAPAASMGQLCGRETVGTTTLVGAALVRFAARGI
jgi:Ser/Thr protein kinase RdoA (MazF antagonist)